MIEPSSERNPVEELAEEFLERFRQGERPSLTEYTRKHPELASDIRELFPALVMLEDVRPAAAATDHEPERGAGAAGRQKLDRLGDFRILREVGRGGMGVVYEAEQESLGRHVALKVLSTHALLDARQLQRFQREARSAARLHHTNIVPVFGVGEHDNLHYYVMQFIHGQGLDQVLEELRLLRLRAGGDPMASVTDIARRTPAAANAPSASAVVKCLLTGVFALPAEEQNKQTADRSDEKSTGAKPHQSGMPAAAAAEKSVLRSAGGAGPSSSASSHVPGQKEKSTLSDSGRPYWESVARIGIQVAEALEYAHGQGTLHRDIKPANLLLDTQGVAWVTDFGLAKASDSEDLTNTGDVVGTLRYLAPERFQGTADVRSDLYALGLTLYEMLALRPAFGESERDKLLRQVMHEEPPRPRKLNPAVPRDLETIVCKAIARDPAHRYQSAAELGEDLKRFRDDKPIRARPVSEIERLLRWCRRNPALAILTSCLFLSLLVGIIGTTMKWREAEQRHDEAELEKGNVIRAERETAKKRDEAIAARNDTRRILAGAMLDRGIALAEQAQVNEGLFWMVEALKAAPDDARDLARVIRTNLAGWMQQSHRVHQTLARPKAPSICAFSADGRHILTATGNEVECWDTATGQPRFRLLSKPDQRRFALDFSPDGKRLVTRGDNKTNQDIAELWDISPPKEPDANGAREKAGPALGDLRRIGAPLSHPARVRSATFTPDGKQVVTGCQDGSARVWDCASGKLVRTVAFSHHAVVVLAVSPDGSMLAAACLTRKEEEETTPTAVYVRDWTGGLLAGPLGHAMGVTDLMFAPGGKTLATASPDGAARIWKTAGTSAVGTPLRHPHAVHPVRFTPDGRTLVTGARDGIVRSWDVDSGRQLISTFAVSRIPVSGLAFSPDGAMLAVRREGIDVCQLDVCALARDRSRPLFKGDDPARLGDWASNTWHRHLASFSPDRRQVLSGGGHGFAHMRDTATGQPAYLGVAGQSNPFRHSFPAVDVTAFSPDGRRFATASRPARAAGEVRLWDAADGRLVALLPHANYVAAMAFSPDGKVLATGGYDRHIHFWDPATGQRLGQPVFQGDIVIHLTFRPDSKLLGVSRTRDYSRKESMIVCEPVTGRQVGATIPTLAAMARFTPDGKQILTAVGLAIKRWDAASGALLSTMTESGEINTLVFSPDGKTMLAGAANGTLQLRDLALGAPLGAPMLSGQRINAAAFSPDPEGRLIVAGCGNGTARLWDRATQKLLGPPVVHSEPVVAVGFTSDGRSFLTTDSTSATRAWPVPMAAGETVEQLARRLQIHTGLEMLEGRAVVPIDPAEWQRRREQFAAINAVKPAGNGLLMAALSPVSATEYHEARLRDAEQDRVPLAALWHLGRLLAAETRPAEKGWLYARRARAYLTNGQFAEAAADTGRASAHIAPSQLTDWYRHCIVDCLGAQQWQSAVWYLDRVVTASPTEWRLYTDRALAHDELGNGKKRDADLARAAQRGADSNFFFQLSDDYAGRGLWDRAKDALTRATAQGPMPPVAFHLHALLALQANDQPEYRSLCERFLKRLGPESQSPELANAFAWLFVLGPDGITDYARPIQLAEWAVNKAVAEERPNALNTLGAVLYRAGRFKDAIARMAEGIRARKDEGVVQDWVFLAMAHERLGNKAEARAYLAKVVRHQAGQTRPGWEYLETDLLHREARVLLDGSPIKNK